MKKMTHPTLEDVKSLCEALIASEGKMAEFTYLTEKQLDDLRWAKDFMNRYEKKHGL